ncbi:AfsR/SARP family transcriptional regulator [Streptomyces roseoverticillatus]|uniref:AfsR/SARP family transcriptional regulator n=1 Tax=Streptomyces roseoverticillatus TaxID=66429 RepID=UPI0005BA219D|nr:AfsR/SARP family transcriptional regulator [Streptomyces roseoverticillatus]
MRDTTEPSTGRLHFQLLGPVRALADDRHVDLGARQQRAMLAVLLLRGGATVSSDELIDALWGENAPPQALGTVRTYASRLRTLLEPGRAARTPATVLVSVAGGYALRVAPEHVDAHVFERLLAEAAAARATGDTATAHDAYAAALELWNGTPLAGLPGPYCERQQDRLSEARLAAQEGRFDCALALGRHAELVPELTSLTAEHPLRERLRAQLILALYRCGRQVDALAAYADARRLLVEELGVEPGPELTRLHAQVLAGDPALALPAPTATAAAGPAEGRRPAGAPFQLPAGIPDFTGREELLGDVRGALTPAAGPAVPIAVLTGIGGVGKTTLAVHAAHLARPGFPDGQLYVDLRGTSADAADSGSVLAHFLQALDVPEPDIPDDLEQRAALYRSVLADRRVLLLLDNARDAAQIRPLLPGTAGSAVLVTTRSRAVTLGGARQFHVGVASEAEALSLLAAIAGEERVTAEPRAAKALAAACGHLPLAVRIVASRLASRPGWTVASLVARLDDERRRLDELQAGDLTVESTFRLGYTHLPADQARAFRLLALADAPDLPLTAAAALLGCDDFTAEDLAEGLADAGMLESYAPGRYRFHDLLRLYARRRAERTEAPEDRRAAVARLLDHLLATVGNASRILEPDHALHRHLHPVTTPGTGFADADEARQWLRREHITLATGLAQAVRELPGALRPSGDLLLTWSGLIEGPAHRDELRRLSELTALAAHAAGDLRVGARARYTLGNLHYLTDVYEAAERELSEALRLADDADDPMCRHLAANALGILCFATDRPARALPLLEQARCLCDALDDKGSEARVLANTARVRLALDRPREAERDAAEAVRIAGATGNGPTIALTLYQHGCVLIKTGRPDLAGRQLQNALGSFIEQQQRGWEGLAWARLAECRLAEWRDEDAVSCAEQSLAIARELGKTYCQGLALAVLGRARTRLGDPSHGHDHLREALTLFERLGVPEAAPVRELLAGAPVRMR